MGSQTFTANGTFTWPVGVTSATVEAWGAGGGGGVSAQGEGGGGGGAYATDTIAKTASTATITVSATGGTTGNNGGDSSWVQNAVTEVLAKGGTAGNARTGGAGGLASASTGATKFDGGSGGSSTGGNAGGAGGGSSAGTGVNGNNGSANSGGTGGAGGTAPTGGSVGGNGGNNTVSGNAPASGNGGGGGGSGAGANGGTGAGGKVIITWSDALSDAPMTGTGVLNTSLNLSMFVPITSDGESNLLILQSLTIGVHSDIFGKGIIVPISTMIVGGSTQNGASNILADGIILANSNLNMSGIISIDTNSILQSISYLTLGPKLDIYGNLQNNFQPSIILSAKCDLNNDSILNLISTQSLTASVQLFGNNINNFALSKLIASVSYVYLYMTIDPENLPFILEVQQS